MQIFNILNINFNEISYTTIFITFFIKSLLNWNISLANLTLFTGNFCNLPIHTNYCGKVKHELRVTSSNPGVTNSNLRVTSSNPRVSSSNPRVRRLKPQVTRLKAWVGTLKARVRRLKARVNVIKPWVR